MIFVLCYVTTLLLVAVGAVAVVVPGVLPWGARGRAARQIDALNAWYGGRRYPKDQPFAALRSKAQGYFAVRDYVGVELAYLAARRIVDEEQP